MKVYNIYFHCISRSLFDSHPVDDHMSFEEALDHPNSLKRLVIVFILYSVPKVFFDLISRSLLDFQPVDLT